MYTILRKQNIGYIAAGVGALAGLIGLFALPYAIFSLNVVFIVTLQIASRTYFFSDLVQEMPANPFMSTTTPSAPNYDVLVQGGLGYGIIWLVVVLTLASLLIALFTLFVARNRSKRLPIALLAIGAVSIFIQLYILLDAAHKLQDKFNTLIDASNTATYTSTPAPTSPSPSDSAMIASIYKNLINLSMNYGAGGWILLIGTIVVMLGALFTLLYKPKSATSTISQNVPGAGVPQPQGAQSPVYPQPEATQYPQQQASAPGWSTPQPYAPPSQSEVIPHPQEPAPQQPYEQFGAPPPEQPGW